MKEFLSKAVFKLEVNGYSIVILFICYFFGWIIAELVWRTIDNYLK